MRKAVPSNFSLGIKSGSLPRLLGSNGSLTGYAGGIDKKIALLELEGIDTNKFIIPKKGTAL